MDLPWQLSKEGTEKLRHRSDDLPSHLTGDEGSFLDHWKPLGGQRRRQENPDKDFLPARKPLYAGRIEKLQKQQLHQWFSHCCHCLYEGHYKEAWRYYKAIICFYFVFQQHMQLRPTTSFIKCIILPKAIWLQPPDGESFWYPCFFSAASGMIPLLFCFCEA